MMDSQRKTHQQVIVITTINLPTTAVETIARLRPEWRFLVVGDRKTPPQWEYPGVEFVSAAQQEALPFKLARISPFNHYARKNIGYLVALQGGATVLAETDDDNIPYESFLDEVDRIVTGRPVEAVGWENVYTHFTDERIWPRGLPLEHINGSLRSPSSLGSSATFDCPIQQFLADGDPDVDAVFRLTEERETYFRPNVVVLQDGVYCPFNSQNTIWWSETFPLLYLPNFVSFRMTDIWRSFIAQVCLYRLGKSLAFRTATVKQIRNEHSLIRDFKDEIPGYLHNAAIIDALVALPLSEDPSQVGDNMRRCYEKLVEMEIVPEKELPLVEAWLEDVRSLTLDRQGAAS